MNHIVINYEQRRQYLLIFIVAIVFSFGLGFWFGYNSNSSDELATALSQMNSQHSQDDASLTPDWSGETTSAADTKSTVENKESKPEIKPAIASKPVAAPAPAPVKPIAKPVVATAPVPKPAAKPVTPPASVASTPAQPMVVKPVSAPVAVPTPPAVTKPAPEPAPVASTESITTTSVSTDAANTQYAVQAGVFESRDNAMKLVTELNAKGFDAYLDEFVASSGDTKFNVRFGLNSDREQVQKRLVRYKQLYTSSAYIISLDK